MNLFFDAFITVELSDQRKIKMDYFIVITTIFCILICLTKADNECTNGKVCMDLQADRYEPCIQSFVDSADSHYVEFCNASRTKICCEPPYIPNTVSERSEFLNITFI